jgi:hypothetical protein
MELATRVQARAREMAKAQCWDHEIAAGLVVDCGIDYDAAERWVSDNDRLLTRARHEGQRDLRLLLDELSRTGCWPCEENKGFSHATALRLAEQYLAGWAKETPTDAVTKALKKALKEQGKNGTKAPALKVAG